MRIIAGIFILLHGLIHLLYFGQSLRFFELQPGMIWPDASWLFSKLLHVENLRLFAGILCILASICFVISGIGFILSTKWSVYVISAAALVSMTIFIIFWNGQWHELDNQGLYSILIDISILLAITYLHNT